MTKAKAKQMAVRLELMVTLRSRVLREDPTLISFMPNDVRRDRDFLAELASELRLLSEGKRLPKKVTR